MIITWFKFKGKFQNDSLIIKFTRNHLDDDADNNNDRTKTICFSQSGEET